MSDKPIKTPNATPSAESYDEKFNRMKKRRAEREAETYTKMTHGSLELDKDAEYLVSIGADPGPWFCTKCDQIFDHGKECPCAE